MKIHTSTRTFDKSFLKNFNLEQPLPKIFPQYRKEKDLKYKKRGSRRRAYTGQEVAEPEETEAKKIAQHEEVLKQDEAAKIGCTQDYMAGKIHFPINDDIEFLRAKDIQNVSSISIV